MLRIPEPIFSSLPSGLVSALSNWGKSNLSSNYNSAPFVELLSLAAVAHGGEFKKVPLIEADGKTIVWYAGRDCRVTVHNDLISIKCDFLCYDKNVVLSLHGNSQCGYRSAVGRCGHVWDATPIIISVGGDAGFMGVSARYFAGELIMVNHRPCGTPVNLVYGGSEAVLDRSRWTPDVDKDYWAQLFRQSLKKDKPKREQCGHFAFECTCDDGIYCDRTFVERFDDLKLGEKQEHMFPTCLPEVGRRAMYDDDEADFNFDLEERQEEEFLYALENAEKLARTYEHIGYIDDEIDISGISFDDDGEPVMKKGKVTEGCF